METTADTNLTNGDSHNHVTDAVVDGTETTTESSFDEAPNDVGDEQFYVSYNDESTEGAAQPLNLSASSTICGYQTEETPPEPGLPMDPDLRRTIDARTLRELGNMSPYLLHMSGGRHMHGYQNISPQNGDPRSSGSSEEGDSCHNSEMNEPPVEGVEGVVDAHYNGLDLSAMSNETEVMRAARALFSKRTRTLYHWIYPETPKIQLKAVVSKAWDSMLNTEKQFYVSQVLGKFGCLQSQLMINPQLGSFATPPTTQEQRTHVQQIQQAHRLYMEEAQRANAALAPPPEYAHMHTQFYNASLGPGPIRRRRGRPRSATTPATLHQRYGDLPSIYVQRLQAVKRLADGDIPMPMMRRCEMDVRECGAVPVGGDLASHAHNRTFSATMTENEFTDDPELRHEFEKFEWTLHMVD